MITITIDNRRARVQAGTTLLEAARRLGIDIPTLCHLEGSEPFTSCMVCLVWESSSGRFLPSCSAPAEQGMVIETDTQAVREARRDVLELLLREHVGDCESPCTRACPLNLDIPATLGRIARYDSEETVIVPEDPVPLLRVIERICPAPCERACRRRLYDEPVSIGLAMRWAAEHESAGNALPARPVPQSSGRRVAVVGAGPAGLSAAFHLTLLGHACTVYDSRSEPGGTLRTGIPEERLPRSLLNDEIARIRDLGVSFHMNRSLGEDVSLRQLRSRHDAVVIATGSPDSAPANLLDTSPSRQGNPRERESFAADMEGVFLSERGARPMHMAAQAVAKGKSVACEVHLYLGGEPGDIPEKRFDLHMGALLDGELEEFLKSASPALRTVPVAGDRGGFTSEEAAAESKRCLFCGCGAKDSCLLRHYAGGYAATGRRFRTPERFRYRRIEDHPLIDYEPSKCIKCGKCVRIAEKSGEAYGLTFSGRSYEVQVAVPLGETLAKGLDRSALQCMTACPTGALTARSNKSEKVWKKP